MRESRSTSVEHFAVAAQRSLLLESTRGGFAYLPASEVEYGLKKAPGEEAHLLPEIPSLNPQLVRLQKEEENCRQKEQRDEKATIWRAKKKRASRLACVETHYH